VKPATTLRGQIHRLLTLDIKRWTLLGIVMALGVGVACYDSDVGEITVGDSIRIEAPAITRTGSTPIQLFTEMHYQPSYRVQEGPRLLPPSQSVPVTGRELRYSNQDEYGKLSVPEELAQSYDPAQAEKLYTINCVVCHADNLRGDGPIRSFMTRGPFPADLTADATRGSTDGELFGFISGGGRQGLALSAIGRESASPMPEFRLLLSEDDRWALVQYLRSTIGR
jgi:mono/diheme cytochrome c family protein